VNTALVSIGVPTFNRADLLPRTLESALAQTWPNLEIFVCDNASTDGTEALCRRYAAADPRIRYLRHARNGGGTFNFRHALEQARGEFFMWLADDDWIEPDYVRACMDALADSAVVLATAPSRLYAPDGSFVRADPDITLRNPDAARRVLSYYARVEANSVMFGVLRRAAGLRSAFDNALAGDWQWMAGVVQQGQVVTVPRSGLHRLLGGMGHQHASVVRGLGLPAFQARIPHAVIAWNVARRLHRDGMSAKTAWTAALLVILRNSWWRRLMPRRWRLPFVARFSAGG
jgi:glycosyltransferase involved in cell wall biosynthesis